MIASATILTSCGPLQVKKKAEYSPETRKEISFTSIIPKINKKIKGTEITISEHNVVSKTFKVNECVVAPIAKKRQPQAVQKAPMTSLFGNFAALAQKMSKKKTPNLTSKNAMTKNTKV